MPGAKNNKPPGPAQWVGGQRRKLVRRNRSNAGPPRSSTMPVLSLDSAAASLVSSISSAGSYYVKDRQSEDSFDRHMYNTVQELEEREETMQLYPPTGAVKPGPPYTPFADGPAASSPNLTATDPKKKHGLFGGKRPKPTTPNQPKTSSSTSVVTSPLPVSTPSKAAKFFGLEAKSSVTESPRRIQPQDDTASDDGAPLGVDRQTKHKKEDVEPDEPPKTSKTATKGLRMLIPEFSGPRRSPVEQTKADATCFDLGEKDGDVGCTGDSHEEVRFRIPAAPHPARTASRSKAARRKPLNAKDFPRMSPITEASFESLRPAYREGEDVTELGAISEYDYEDPPPLHSAPVLPCFSHQESTLPGRDKFELDEADLSPTEEFYEKEATDEDEDVVHPGTKVKVKRVHWQQGMAAHFRSPLQTAEDAWLDATEEEMRLEARKMTIAGVEAKRQTIDDELAELKGKHGQFKLEFASGSNVGSINTQPKSIPDDDSEGDDTDLVSLCSSIDLDEEPTVHQAKLMTSTRITPGMIKLVDIPPRKKKPVAHVESKVSVPDKIAPVEQQKSITACARSENMLPPSPVVTHYHNDDPDRSTKPKKSKLTRDESRLLVQNWVSDYNSTEQRPISTRVDPDVLADQETPPAPFPKGDESLSTPPFKPRSDSLKQLQHIPKHQCINNGHIFHPVDLKTIPDSAVINSLGVRPYLQTYTGIKQHVKIPVVCEKCCEDCDENVWECEISVCRMAVCQNCAEDMEAEWQERAVNGWKYK
ncbi:uncharacterized protein M421DRAFT_1233 [Didymella exigua CBS 183.55]|uniref:Uncharacterized protein n=1 Tax=Didymella exigua CBS 183.55 TaxID=1150837 RepID=A0A6A5RXN8_9PLEO|nr:uncharacterized protein M421DRAFT_1233 [Didymella exigua CBS 183.55]KAF1932612.1 hypothetical protein M421DRAFT_1233 [Didymella exigua CBS 183.55]